MLLSSMEFDFAKPKDTGKGFSLHFQDSEFHDCRYEHLDLNDLERILEETQSCRRRLVVTDGVFSMDGDIAPLCKSFILPQWIHFEIPT